MNILGLFHAVSPETVQKMDSDLKESQAACERQATRLTESITYGCELQQLVSDSTRSNRDLLEQLEATKRRAGEAIVAGANLRKLLDGVEGELESLRSLREAEGSFHARREATLKGQITKLKKKLEAR